MEVKAAAESCSAAAANFRWLLLRAYGGVSDAKNNTFKYAVERDHHHRSGGGGGEVNVGLFTLQWRCAKHIFRRMKVIYPARCHADRRPHI